MKTFQTVSGIQAHQKVSMKTFKQYLAEALTPQQYQHYSQLVQMSPEARERTDEFFGKGNDFIKENLKFAEPVEKSDIHKAVEHHIGQQIDIPHYISGKTNPNERGRQVRLGKVIKDPELLQRFSVDPSRTGGKSDANQGYVTIHRGTQVAGQTNPERTECNPTGHSWKYKSCKNINSGGYSHVIPQEIEHGTVVMFGHDHSGKEIYRATLQPYHHGNHTIYSVNSQYGNKHPAFVNHAHDVATRLSSKTAPKDAVYEVSGRVYNDAPSRLAFHPDAPSKTITDAYYEDSLSGWSRNEAASVHPKLPSWAIDNDIDEAFNSVSKTSTSNSAPHRRARIRLRRLAVNSAPTLTKQHISKIISGYASDQEDLSASDLERFNPISAGINALMDHHNFDSSHVREIINTLPKDELKYSRVRNRAINHPKAKTKDLVSVMLDPNESSLNREDATDHEKLDKTKAGELIHNERFNPDPRVRMNVASNIHVRHDTLQDMRNDEDKNVNQIVKKRLSRKW